MLLVVKNFLIKLKARVSTIISLDNVVVLYPILEFGVVLIVFFTRFFDMYMTTCGTKIII